MDTAKEGSSAWITVNFLDRTGSPEVPATVTWEAHDKGTGDELQEATSVTPGAEIEIEIPGSVNAIHTPGQPYETRVITVRATYGGSSTHNDQFEYVIADLAHV